MANYIANIVDKTLQNDSFRQVHYTGKHMQLVVMSLKPGEDIGVEVHLHVDQFFRVEQGEGKVTINGEEAFIKDDDVVIVPAGAEHNILNTGSVDLKLYTIYTPPNHIDGRTHKTKADAIADEEDEAYGSVNE